MTQDNVIDKELKIHWYLKRSSEIIQAQAVNPM